LFFCETVSSLFLGWVALVYNLKRIGIGVL
jgi:hypothetical protein